MARAIYRTTYKNLYLFKKTLVETGQSVLAAAVPVKLEERNTASLVTETAVQLAESELLAEGIASDERLLTYLRYPIEQGMQFYV